MGVHVADYVDSFHSPNSPISWKRAGDWQSENNLKLDDILKSRKTFVTYENDSIVWNAAKLGKYRVNLGYKLQRKRQKDVVRDEEGSLVGAICGPVGVASNKILEITTLEEGLKLVCSNGFTKVMIEGDSQIILNGIIKNGFTNWRSNAWIQRIKSLIDKLLDYQVHHIYREGNKVADFLANKGISESRPVVMSSVEAGFRDLQKILYNDSEHITRMGVG
ncbi:uncharacterized protein LOC131860303 [Cryptomeria japonica]|uniref:uncharacterized protein LOC131860303 n=1 Tax=Cryptomeria japonica TaxID=3369 RepID=UPI0027DA7399|nr:uncharacterized protein LOC131860303 [Cryptomeria japonica]